MDETRRSFLKKTGCTVLGLGCGLPLLNSVRASASTGHSAGKVVESQLAMVIDIRKCQKKEIRDACYEACRIAHNLPVYADRERDARWIWSDKFEHAFPNQSHNHIADSLKGLPVLILCNHCSSPACIKVCPTGATWKRKQDGIVMMDMHRCIGCRYCVVACPYGARSFNWGNARPRIEGETTPEYPTREKGVVEKCTFCAERIRVDREPACVEAAGRIPGGEGALTFGNLADRTSEATRLLREKRTISRNIGLGTDPNVYYII